MPETSPTHSLVTWQAHLSAAPSAGFEILAITAGEGNGWRFSPQVLQDSLPLWEGVKCFVDHRAGPRSLRDLAGVGESPHLRPSSRKAFACACARSAPPPTCWNASANRCWPTPLPAPTGLLRRSHLHRRGPPGDAHRARALGRSGARPRPRGAPSCAAWTAAALSTSNPSMGDAMDDPTPTPQPQPQPQSTPTRSTPRCSASTCWKAPLPPPTCPRCSPPRYGRASRGAPSPPPNCKPP